MDKKIIVIQRSLNEEANIRQFCKSYSWADKILVADGLSKDRTVEFALQFPNVEVRNYDEIIDGGYTHHSKHLNFAIEWAMEYEPDWIISDDCDSLPTNQLEIDGREILNTTSWDAVFVRRYYLWYKDLYGWYFPDLDVGASLWAWNARVYHPHCVTNSPDSKIHPVFEDSLPLTKEPTQSLPDPYRLLHYWYRSEEHVNQKTFDYEARGCFLEHPLLRCGGLAQLPDWAYNIHVKEFSENSFLP